MFDVVAGVKCERVNKFYYYLIKSGNIYINRNCARIVEHINGGKNITFCDCKWDSEKREMKSKNGNKFDALNRSRARQKEKGKR